MKRAIVYAAILTIAAGLATYFVLGRNGEEKVKAVNVGGVSNQCQCTKRLER